ncbi:MAG: DNA mismatch repair protein MutS [Bacteroides sp.]|nr:MAG: DNA mismatch repair protein MutS [Bacteroides sp.]
MNDTPIIKQYLKIKNEYPNMILLFRIGDFYETFNEDAIKISNILNIVLTKRNNGIKGPIPLAGFPYHSLNNYLPKIIQSGNKVAICEQLENAQKGKNIIKRGVTEIITPGIAFNDLIYDKNNYLSCIYAKSLDYNIIGMSLIDISTGEFFIYQGSKKSIHNLLDIYNPNEVLVNSISNKIINDIHIKNFYVEKIDDWLFNYHNCIKILLSHFKTTSLCGFDINEGKTKEAIIAAGVCLNYIYKNNCNNITHISNIFYLNDSKYVYINDFTLKNLEILYSNSGESKTLYHVINKTQSAMGARMLKKWLIRPLIDIKSIQSRNSIVELIIKNDNLRKKLKKYIFDIKDLEKLSAKISLKKVNIQELMHLCNQLRYVDNIYKICKKIDNIHLQNVIKNIVNCDNIINIIENNIYFNELNNISSFNTIIKINVYPHLDLLKNQINELQNKILQLEKHESKISKIDNLKIDRNNIIGFFIEINNSSKNHKIPAEWFCKQTLKYKSRYISKELKDIELKINYLENKISIMESHIYDDILNKIIKNINKIQKNALIVATIDVLLSFSIIAVEKNYIKPNINDKGIIDIKKGRHPIIEEYLSPDKTYIENDIYIDNYNKQILVITGPNMSGKSAILRQTGIIVLMAHIGSFVPAKYADISLTDKIFTRVGASDNIALGSSTFMVEMQETASIINNMSNKSLILLDEIGRGTSTYDGISIAWSIIDYIHNNNKNIFPKTLFATHYHELGLIARFCKRIHNYNVNVKKIENNIFFLYKLVPGVIKHSFGINVAYMSGMPKTIVDNSYKILSILEKNNSEIKINLPIKGTKYNLQFFICKIYHFLVKSIFLYKKSIMSD